MINFREVVQGTQAMVLDQAGEFVSEKEVIDHLMQSDLEQEAKNLKEMGFMK